MGLLYVKKHIYTYIFTHFVFFVFYFFSLHYFNIFFSILLSTLWKPDVLGCLGSSVVEHLPLAQVMIPGSWEGVLYRAPQGEPAFPSAYVSASLCFSWINKILKKAGAYKIATRNIPFRFCCCIRSLQNWSFVFVCFPLGKKRLKKSLCIVSRTHCNFAVTKS